uniref:ZP domain-containing protein n=1 Tax=Denticeps clupeoides TaxID=299321 RepID=A0AAY4D5M0_9TELE
MNLTLFQRNLNPCVLLIKVIRKTKHRTEITQPHHQNEVSDSRYYNDISVFCGTNYVRLSIFICPVMYAGLNESMLFLNNMNDPNCKGTLDTSVTPPVVRFTFPLNSSSACGSVFTTITSLGSGIYSDFSKVQTVNISGIVRSVDPSTSIVTYNTDLTYYYSCSYPLQYLLNNTDVSVSASSIAVRDNNGSFISTLKIGLFRDANYTNPLAMPSQGIELKTNIYVQVQATNLTSQYFVLLDRCYASTSPLPSNSSFFNLFVSCSIDKMTTVVENGQSQSAKFYFPAFRFREQQNMTLSTYYLHCITRLCEPASCSQFWVLYLLLSCKSNLSPAHVLTLLNVRSRVPAIMADGKGICQAALPFWMV